MTATPTTFNITYRIATDHQAVLRDEAAQAHATQSHHRRSGEPLPPTRGPLSTLRRRLAGTASFA
jgi:hypothetical protein